MLIKCSCIGEAPLCSNFRVKMPTYISAIFIPLALVGGEWKDTLGYFSSQALCLLWILWLATIM